MASSSNTKHYDGTSDVEAFITRVELKANIKGHVGEKCAQYMASLLAEGHALNVYLKLSADDKKDCEKIKEALRKEFDASHRNRDVALEKLSKRKPEKGESPSSFAYKLMELAKLAYGGLADASQKTIVKDYFVAAQSREMRVALKSLADFQTKTVTDLATEVTRLQTAGVPSVDTSVKSEESGIYNVDCDGDEESAMVDKIADKVVQKLACMKVDAVDDLTTSDTLANYVGSGRGRSRRNNYRGNRSGTNRGRGSDQRGADNSNVRKCRNCQSTGHVYTKCPTRFCQACGQRGHDGWSRDCPNYR